MKPRRLTPARRRRLETQRTLEALAAEPPSPLVMRGEAIIEKVMRELAQGLASAIDEAIVNGIKE